MLLHSKGNDQQSDVYGNVLSSHTSDKGLISKYIKNSRPNIKMGKGQKQTKQYIDSLQVFGKCSTSQIMREIQVKNHNEKLPNTC